MANFVITFTMLALLVSIFSWYTAKASMKKNKNLIMHEKFESTYKKRTSEMVVMMVVAFFILNVTFGIKDIQVRKKNIDRIQGAARAIANSQKKLNKNELYECTLVALNASQGRMSDDLLSYDHAYEVAKDASDICIE